MVQTAEHWAVHKNKYDEMNTRWEKVSYDSLIMRIEVQWLYW